jgi:CO/xanthine dehydrogenase FAD-binding subunit
LNHVKPPPFKYLRAESLEHALEALSQHPADAKVISGGQSLCALLNMRLSRPDVLVDISRLDELQGIGANGALTIGAATRQVAVERSAEVAAYSPLIPHALRYVGHIAIRSRGTVGGSIAHADPAAEMPAVALALGAEMTVAGPGGERVIGADDFFRTYFTTALEDGEILRSITYPAASRDRRWGFEEVSRRHGDFALVGAAVTAEVASDGTCEDARIALFGVGETALRASRAEAFVAGRRLDDPDVLRQAGELAAEGLTPPSDVHGDDAYRRDVARAVVRRALEQTTRGAD